jgi:hypothetical protein
MNLCSRSGNEADQPLQGSKDGPKLLAEQMPDAAGRPAAKLEGVAHLQPLLRPVTTETL